MTKLAPGSNLTVADQKRLYAEAVSEEALARQAAMADKEARRCTCTPSSVKRRWQDADKATSRRVHHPACAKFKPWMEEGRGDAKWTTA